MIKYTKDICIALLKQKAFEFEAQNQSRFPQRSDFTPEEVCAIKAHLGPWPRALEAAGLKAPRNDNSAEKNREKRIRAKRHLAEIRGISKNSNNADND